MLYLELDRTRKNSFSKQIYTQIREQILSGEIMRLFKRARGIQCHPDQIVITSGVKQGLSLVAKCLLNVKSEVWIENPSNENVKQIFSYHTDKIIPFEVDKEGIQPSLFPSGKRPTLIFVTPSHQFPMGGILPIQRRIELIQFAREANCYLLPFETETGNRCLKDTKTMPLEAGGAWRQNIIPTQKSFSRNLSKFQSYYY